MDPMSEYVARAVIEARLADGHEIQRGRQINHDRRAEWRRQRRLAIERWWRGRASRGSDPGQSTTHATTTGPARQPSIELARILEAAACRVVERGTFSERRLLEAMSQVAATSVPDAAAAMLDQGGTESSRLRAFGLVHDHLLDVLGPREHAWLLDLCKAPAATQVRGCVV